MSYIIKNVYLLSLSTFEYLYIIQDVFSCFRVKIHPPTLTEVSLHLNLHLLKIV